MIGDTFEMSFLCYPVISSKVDTRIYFSPFWNFDECKCILLFHVPFAFHDTTFQYLDSSDKVFPVQSSFSQIRKPTHLKDNFLLLKSACSNLNLQKQTLSPFISSHSSHPMSHVLNNLTDLGNISEG